MFDRHETALDMGNVVIRAFDHRNLVVAIIDYHDFKLASSERPINVNDPCAFIEQNIDEFLIVLWSKYVGGEGRRRQRQGTVFTRIELSEGDIAKIVASSKRPSAPGTVLRARPNEGKIDYAELSREHMKRYPKIRAALAK